MSISQFLKLVMSSKHWRWMPGMRAISFRDGDLENVIQRVPDDPRGWRLYSEDAVPDLTDPATLGCIVKMMIDVYKDETADTCNADIPSKNISVKKIHLSEK